MLRWRVESAMLFKQAVSAVLLAKILPKNAIYVVLLRFQRP
jgi:hypothetical protein